jgi:hypothetical protein
MLNMPNKQGTRQPWRSVRYLDMDTEKTVLNNPNTASIHQLVPPDRDQERIQVLERQFRRDARRALP